jgi:hypothetical protein
LGRAASGCLHISPTKVAIVCAKSIWARAVEVTQKALPSRRARQPFGRFLSGTSRPNLLVHTPPVAARSPSRHCSAVHDPYQTIEHCQALRPRSKPPLSLNQAGPTPAPTISPARDVICETVVCGQLLPVLLAVASTRWSSARPQRPVALPSGAQPDSW